MKTISLYHDLSNGPSITYNLNQLRFIPCSMEVNRVYFTSTNIQPSNSIPIITTDIVNDSNDEIIATFLVPQSLENPNTTYKINFNQTSLNNLQLTLNMKHINNGNIVDIPFTSGSFLITLTFYE